MNWFVLKTTADYKKAIRRTMEIFNAAPGSNEEKELDLLLVLVKDYEDRHYTLPDVQTRFSKIHIACIVKSRIAVIIH